jgi:hypothetical protein
MRMRSPALPRAPSPSSVEAGPYLDYGRFLTPEGGIRIVFKDLDLRLRHGLWRAFAWITFTGGEAWSLLTHSPLQSEWIEIACLVVVAGINLLILWKMPEVYRSVEIRPDCMIIEGEEVFWLHQMATGFPTLRREDENKQILCGIYGTRFVEYLTVRRFDENDRTPEVFAAQLADAMRQLWEIPGASGAREGGRSPW